MRERVIAHEWEHDRMSDTIWPGQKVAGHDAAISRVSRAQADWHAGCSCGWTGEIGDRRHATADRDKHLRDAVDAGSAIIGGGRQAPTGP
jgi:hypothetical protein